MRRLGPTSPLPQLPSDAQHPLRPGHDGRTNIAVTGTGTVTVRASQAGDQSFKAAIAVDRSFIRGFSDPYGRAGDKTNVYGAAVPPLTASIADSLMATPSAW